MPKGPETKIVDKMIKWLRSQGGWWVKIHGGIFQVGGIPDIIGCYRGRFCGFEVKIPKKYAKENHGLTDRQKAVLELIKKAGGIAEVLCSLQQLREIWHKSFDQRIY